MKLNQRAILAIGLLLSSCGDTFDNTPEELTAREYVTNNVDDIYEIQTADYMSSSSSFNADASFEAQNMENQTFVMVIHEPKEEFERAFRTAGEYIDSLSALGNYAQVQYGSLQASIAISSAKGPIATNIHGLDAQIVEFTGSVEDVAEEISYIVGFLEGKENLFMIMTWTLESRYERFERTLRSCLMSFKELDGPDGSVTIDVYE